MPPRKPRLPSTNIRKPANMTSGVTSTVRNVSNTGQMSTSTQTTGATGAVRNTNNFTTTQGAPGQSGASSVQVNPGRADVNLTPTPSFSWDGVNAIVNTPDLSGSASQINVGETVRGAYAQIEGQLASARQTALGQVPREYHDRVNTAFDTASSQVAEHKRRMGY